MQARVKLAVSIILSIAACDDSDVGTSDAGRGAAYDATTKPVDARAALTVDAEAMASDSSVSACEVAGDCLAVRTLAVNLDPCCSDSFSCGLKYVGGAALQQASFYSTLGLEVGACVPPEKLFFTGKTGQSERVPVEDGGQVLVSTDCPTAFITSMSFRGCCLPTNECALTSYAIHTELGVLAGDAGVPFAQTECVKSDELNAQLKASSLAGLARLPEVTASCDYAALDSTLPRL